MKIYIAHSTGYDYQEELYKPIRNSILSDKHEIVLPHENNIENFSSKEYFNNCDLVIAEVSFPSTGMGIELGWANIQYIRVVCIYKIGTKPSSALNTVSKDFIEYSSSNELIQKLESFCNLTFASS